MRRARFVFASLVVLLGLVALAFGPRAVAQDATPTAGSLAGHPLVGSWIITDPTGGPSVTAFTADGIVVDNEADGGTGVGSWQSTGPNSAAFTMVIPLTGQGVAGIITIRATVEVDPSGASLVAPYSYTVSDNTGTVRASGKGQVTGVRVPVESPDAMGSPVAGFPTWVPQPEGPPPAATPAS